MSSFEDYFSKHEEQAFIGKAFLTIIVIILVREYFSGLLALIILLFPVIFLVYIRLQAAALDMKPSALLAQHITFLPVMRTDKEVLRKETPYVTYGLVLLNVLIFYIFEVGFETGDFISNNLVFLPRDPNFLNVPLSLFTSMFLHASNGHLWGNMLFLWVLGGAVERRLGSGRFSMLYLITGLFGNLAFILVKFAFSGTIGHILGASGAIAGIMGIFAVRCYFKSMVFPLPILGIFSLILPISLKARLNSLVIIGLFFLADLSGGIDQMAGDHSSMIGHWAHLGGMISGMIIASRMKLAKEAVEERHLEAGVKAAHAQAGYSGGEKSLAIVLQTSPDNPDALLAMAQLKTKFAPTDEGREYYIKAITALLKTRQREAAEVFKEYYKKYLKGLDASLLVSLAGILQRNHDLDTAARCLEMAASDPNATPQIKERATFQNALLLERMGFDEAALGVYQSYLKQYPDGEGAAKARMRLGLPEPPSTSAVRTPAPQQPQTVQVTATAVAKRCPSCNAIMSKRTANSGVHTGKQFWVCEGYPSTCKTVEAIS